MSLAKRSKIHFGDDGGVSFVDRNEEAIQRFREVKDVIRHREPFEVTNAYVLSVLLDVYWLHAENGGEA